MPPQGTTPEPSVVSRLEALATAIPSHPALIGRDGALSFAAMNVAANQVAHRLRAILGERNGCVGICMQRTVGRIVAALGILKAGYAYVPIDPALHETGRRDLAAHAEVLYILTDLASGTMFGPDTPTLDYAALAATGRQDNPAIRVDPEALALIRYTSGSTGTPKGVLNNHRAALGQALSYAEATGLREGDRLCCLSFFPHPIILGTLLSGGAYVVVDPVQEGLRAMAARLDSDRVSVLSASPSSLRSLAVALDRGGRPRDLRCVALSGEPVSADDINLARRLTAEGGIAINNYGTSEFTQIASNHIREDQPGGMTIPVGRPPSGVTLRLLDAEGLPVPAGEAGEIAVRASFMSSGYWKRPDLTRVVYGSDTPQDGRTDYRTGDIGRFDAGGQLCLLGRVDNQIKLRGHRVIPEEIEVVLRRHPAVAAVAVHANSAADSTMVLAAFVVAAEGVTPDAAALRAHAREHLPPYMRPSVFVWMTALPTTPAGKLHRAALPDPLAHQAQS